MLSGDEVELNEENARVMGEKRKHADYRYLLVCIWLYPPSSLRDLSLNILLLIFILCRPFDFSVR